MWLDTPSQRGGVGVIPRPRPLGDINAAMRDLDLGADGIRALVEEGRLIAFNISARTGGAVTMRILTASLQFYQTTGRRLDLDWPTTISLILPIEREHVQGIELERCLNCDRGHVENLIDGKLITQVKPAKPGPGGSAVVLCKSVDTFLEGRLL